MPSNIRMLCLLLVDTSDSMTGQHLEELDTALDQFSQKLCNNRLLLERLDLDVAIVEFNSTANIVQPFMPIQYMESVQLTAGSGSDITVGLQKAIDMIDKHRQSCIDEGSQLLCPWIVMITDGGFTDSIDCLAEEIARLDNEDKLRLWAFTVQGANTESIYKLCNGKRVIELKDYDFTNVFDCFIKSMGCGSVIHSFQPGERAELPPNVVPVINDEWM